MKFRIEQILTKTFTLSCVSLLFLFTSNESVMARTPDEITKSGKIRIGICNDQPPVQFRKNNGELVGIDPDLGKMIAGALGVIPEWTDIKGGPKFRAESLIEKRVDIVISTLSITKERMDVINLSEPYFTTGLGLMIRSDKKEQIRSYHDLEGRSVGVVKGTTGEKLLSGLGFDIKTLLVHDSDALYATLKKGDADAIVDDLVFLEHYASGKKDVIVLDDTLSADQYGIGINKDDSQLTEFIDRLVSNIKADGRLDSIIKKYINNGSSQFAVSGFDPKDKGLTTYEIQPSDTLMGIARRFYNDPTKWLVLYNANQDSIKVVNVLLPGTKIRIPDINMESSGNSSQKNVSTQEASKKNPSEKTSALEAVMKKAASRPPMPGDNKQMIRSSKIKEYDLNDLEKDDNKISVKQ